MSDERDDARSAGPGADSEDTGGQTAVVTRPTRPTGKRARRAVDGEDTAGAETEGGLSKNGGTATKTAKKAERPGKRRLNPFAFVWNYLAQVVAELRKVIWPNRKQMVTYTIVVLVFLAFMVAMIGGVDFGLRELISLVFG
ncbi:preprotein translocase subunit SecE [Mycobacterium hubeiense]|uniref:preprotein translocase subunit SecE n=1 Tax=Mycobacterium hubeiense TaxID=1867256 RepID=UPI000C7ECC18|nr:preprotein translocase subunit SecE [Mycobacterium sp. QGD 101]